MKASCIGGWKIWNTWLLVHFTLSTSVSPCGCFASLSLISPKIDGNAPLSAAFLLLERAV